MAERFSSQKKHIFSVRGRVVRQRSEEEEENKRGRFEEDPNSSFQEETPNIQTSDMNTQADFDKKMENALSNEKIAALYVNLFKKSMDKTVKEIHGRLDKVEMEGVVRDERLEYLEWKVDEAEQEKRVNNIIITGLDSNQANKKEVATFLNDTVKCNIDIEDINYVLKLGRNDNDSNSSNKLRVRVAFPNYATKEKVIKRRKILKGKQTWISDDLTPRKDKLAYLARQSVKEGRASLTWTYDGKVFIKTTVDGKAKKIAHACDIP